MALRDVSSPASRVINNGVMGALRGREAVVDIGGVPKHARWSGRHSLVNTSSVLGPNSMWRPNVYSKGAWGTCPRTGAFYSLSAPPVRGAQT